MPHPFPGPHMPHPFPDHAPHPFPAPHDPRPFPHPHMPHLFSPPGEPFEVSALQPSSGPTQPPSTQPPSPLPCMQIPRHELVLPITQAIDPSPHSPGPVLVPSPGPSVPRPLPIGQIGDTYVASCTLFPFWIYSHSVFCWGLFPLSFWGLFVSCYVAMVVWCGSV